MKVVTEEDMKQKVSIKCMISIRKIAKTDQANDNEGQTSVKGGVTESLRKIG